MLPVDRLQTKAASGPGNVVVLIGAKTGRDGIGGVSVLASAAFDAGGRARRPSVQVGDPFTEKLLIEACLEIYNAGLVVGIQDLGGAGLTCALSETSAAAGAGMAVNLDLVPLREPSMRPHEVLASESQERMLLIVTPENLPVVLSICARWGVIATAIGEVIGPPPDGSGARLVIWWRGGVVVDVPPGSLADDGPVYARPMREPERPGPAPRGPGRDAAAARNGDELRETLLRLAASPNLCDKTWVTEQYDRYVLGNTVLAQPEDAGVLRVDEGSGLGVALSVDGNGRFARLDPYTGAKLALAEAYRNVAVTGATPVAVTNCLNFGSPEDPASCGSSPRRCAGSPTAARNSASRSPAATSASTTRPARRPSTRRRSSACWASSPTSPIGCRWASPTTGDPIFLLGETREELSGSEWAHVTHGHLGGTPPRWISRPSSAWPECSPRRHGSVTSPRHMTCPMAGWRRRSSRRACGVDFGAQVMLPEGSSPFVQLFSESAGAGTRGGEAWPGGGLRGARG